MSRDRKTGLEWYGYANWERSAARLERMHAKGWHLEKATGAALRYRRGEREKVHYAVTCFPEASVFDGSPTEGQLTYADYCAQAGWEFVCAYGPIQYFRSARPDPVPIETDEREKLRAIHRTTLKTQTFFWCWASVAAVLMMCAMLAVFSRRPLEFAASSTMLSGLLLAGVILFAQLWQVGGYWLWYARARLSVAGGGRCPAESGLRFWGTWALVAALVVLVGCDILLSERRWVLLLRTALYVLLVFGCGRLLSFLKGRGYEREEVRSSYLVVAVIAAVTFAVAMSVVEGNAEAWGLVSPRREPAYVWTTPLDGRWNVYLDPLPVMLEDLGIPVSEEDHYSYTAEEERSVLAVRGEYDQTAWSASLGDRHPGLYYSITEIPWGWLREWCWKKQIHFYRNINFEIVNDPRWGAVEVRQGSGDMEDRYMLLYVDRIVLLFASNMELTDGQVSILVQRLGQPENNPS